MRPPRTFPRSLIFALSTLAISAASLGALAQPAVSEDEKRAAKELANKGYEQYEAGEYDKAVKLFVEAAKHFPAPTILLVTARSEEKLERFVEAQGHYRRIASMELAPDAPKEFADAKAAAEEALPKLSGRIAFVKIVLKGMTADRVQITIDDAEVPQAKILEPIPQNPGTHKIVATIGGDDGGRSVFQSVTLKEGVTKQIQLVFRPGGAITSGELPPGGGCASCEIGNLRGHDSSPEALLAAATLALFFGARSRWGRPRRRS